MYKHLASLKTEANKSNDYRQRNNGAVAIKKQKTHTKTLPETILNDIKSHILSQGLDYQEIYTSLLAIATTKYTIKKNKAPVIDVDIIDVQCNKCLHKYTYERRKGDGGHACPECGHAPGIDIYEGDPFPNYENVIPQWSLVYTSNDLNTIENAMAPFTNLLHLTPDQLEYAKRIVRAKTSINDPNPHVIVAAIIYVTNPDILETKRIITHTPTHGQFKCKTCAKPWHSRKCALMCCKYGPSGDSCIPINKGIL